MDVNNEWTINVIYGCSFWLQIARTCSMSHQVDSVLQAPVVEKKGHQGKRSFEATAPCGPREVSDYFKGLY